MDIGSFNVSFSIGFLVDDCVPMDTYITRDPSENDILTYVYGLLKNKDSITNSNKAFISFKYF